MKNITENIVRDNFNPIETAHTLQKLLYRQKLAKISEETGISLSRFCEISKLTKLNKRIQDDLRNSEVSKKEI